MPQWYSEQVMVQLDLHAETCQRPLLQRLQILSLQYFLRSICIFWSRAIPDASDSEETNPESVWVSLHYSKRGTVLVAVLNNAILIPITKIGAYPLQIWLDGFGIEH